MRRPRHSGRGAGFADERHLWPYWFHLIRVCRPVTVFGEQVASKAALEWLDLVQDDLEGEGYAVGAADLCAASVGAFHIRQRLWFVGYSPGIGGGDQRGLGTPGREVGEQKDGAGLTDESGDGCENADLLADPGLPRHPPRGKGNVSPEDREKDCGGETGINGRNGGSSGGMADTFIGNHRSEVETSDPGEPEANGPADRLGGHSGPPHFWSPCEWLPCRDGRHRPALANFHPLVDGLSCKLGSGSPLEGKSRVGMLKGAGNAIVPQVAEVFIRAFMEIKGEK